MSHEIHSETKQEHHSVQHHIKRAQLPVCCPPKQTTLWNAHPRVYLPLAENHREAICPYCDAEFILVD